MNDVTPAWVIRILLKPLKWLMIILSVTHNFKVVGYEQIII